MKTRLLFIIYNLFNYIKAREDNFFFTFTYISFFFSCFLVYMNASVVESTVWKFFFLLFLRLFHLFTVWVPIAHKGPFPIWVFTFGNIGACPRPFLPQLLDCPNDKQHISPGKTLELGQTSFFFGPPLLSSQLDYIYTIYFDPPTASLRQSNPRHATDPELN